VFADLADSGEAEVFEQFDGCGGQQSSLCFAVGGHLGDGLDQSAASCRDLL
jgi:hypothetical protein